MIDHVMRFNREAAGARMAGLARVCDSRGVAREHLPRLVEVAAADTCHRTNPRPCSAADFERIFTAAL